MDSGEPTLTPTLLADLDAGLLDDATAARVRRLADTDRSAPDVPPEVTDRVVAALRRAPTPPDG